PSRTVALVISTPAGKLTVPLVPARKIASRLMAAVSAALKSRTTASRAARRVTSCVVFHTYMMRPNSAIPNSTMKKTTAISANSTAATPRCERAVDKMRNGIMASSIHVAHGGMRAERDAGIAGSAGNERHHAANRDGIGGNADLHAVGCRAVGARHRRSTGVEAGDDD